MIRWLHSTVCRFCKVGSKWASAGWKRVIDGRISIVVRYVVVWAVLSAGCASHLNKQVLDNYRIRIHPASRTRDIPVERGDGTAAESRLPRAQNDVLMIVIRGRL